MSGFFELKPKPGKPTLLGMGTGWAEMQVDGTISISPKLAGSRSEALIIRPSQFPQAEAALKALYNIEPVNELSHPAQFPRVVSFFQPPPPPPPDPEGGRPPPGSPPPPVPRVDHPEGQGGAGTHDPDPAVLGNPP